MGLGLSKIEENIRVYSVDKHGTKFGSGPIENCTVEGITWELDGAGTASISFDPLARNAREVRLIEREIQIWFDEKLVWWGIPWRDQGGLDRVNIQCDGLLAWFTKRYIDRTSLLYTSIDQFQIAWNLLAYAQDESVQANRDLNISASFTPSGKVRSENYDRAQHAEILSLIERFPTLEDGFDFEITYDETGQRLWVPYYPKKGSFLGKEWGIRVTEDVMVGATGIQQQNDGGLVITHAYVAGGTSGDVKFEEDYEDVAASARYGVMQGVISEGSQKDPAWLLERATRVVNARKSVSPVPAMTLSRTDEKDYFNAIDVGDTIPVYMDYGYYQIDGNFRVGKKSYAPGGCTIEFITEDLT